ncbi:MAG: hypothetical protein D6711_09110 [Chloroflexi bacterium]|nr:MAG: hypothetical protein D6711_09110 [Chloroflexota bacterium]
MEQNKQVFISHKQVPRGLTLLGRNQQQSASELQAGARAELTPSPLNQALSSMRGRLVYQTARFLINHEGFTNYVALRIPLAKQIIQGAIPHQNKHPVIVELGVGFSPLSVLLAEELPNATVIELDTEEIIKKRQKRLRNANLPQNLESVAADLSQVSLLEALGGRKPDVIEFTGAYYVHDELIEVLNYFHSVLNDEGSLAMYIPWQPGVDAIRATARFFKRQIGDYPGIVRNVEEIHTLMSRTNFQSHTVIFPSQYAPHLKPLDVEVMVLAKR